MSNFLKDTRHISSKVVFEPNNGNIGEIYSIFVNNASDDYIAKHNCPVDDYGNVTLYRKDVFDANINENDCYISKFTTDKDGYVIDTNTGKKSTIWISVNLDPNIPINIRFFQLAGSKDEYPLEFSVSFSDPQQGYGLSTRYNVLDNTINPCTIDFGSYFPTYENLTVNISRWSKPLTTVKIGYIGIKSMFEIYNPKRYEYSSAAKTDNQLNYGCKYNYCTLELFNTNKSYGRMYKEKEKIESDNTTTTEITRMKPPLNILELLSELSPYKTKMMFYVKTEFDKDYIYNGKFYIQKVTFDTQSKTTKIDAYDIVQQLQTIKYDIGDIGTDVSLYYIIDTISNYLKTNYNISLNVVSGEYYLKNIIIHKAIYDSYNIWDFLDKISILGQLYVVANLDNEEKDIDIICEA